MFHKLRIQLTALCMGVTGFILILFTLLCLFLSEQKLRSGEESSFLTNLNTMYQNLQIQSALSHSWIRQMEHHYQFILRLRDNGTPLFFQELQEGQEQSLLLNLAERTALSQYQISAVSSKAPSSHIEHYEFSLTAESGDEFLASIALIPKSGSTLSVTVLHDLSSLNEQLYQQRRLFSLAALTSFAVLSLFFWFFIDRMLRPLRENQKKQVEFIASASHELRSPLTVIRSNVDSVRNGSMEADVQFLDTLSLESQRMSRLISDMLQLASADSRSWSIQTEPVEMDTLLLQVWESFEALAETKSLSWNISLPEDTTPKCICDRERIGQLLSILIDNAFCYTPPGGWITLSLENDASHIRILVSDNGPGIPDEQKAAVFERFYCADTAHKNKAHFGLGLCIAKEIVKLHRGNITVQDTKGGGATFVVSLPLKH